MKSVVIVTADSAIAMTKSRNGNEGIKVLVKVL